MKNKNGKETDILRRLGTWMVIFLIIQYILGMTSNLFVSFPTTGDVGVMWEFAWHQIPVASHIIVGSSIFIFSIIILVIAIKRKERNRIISGTIGLISIFLAGFSGAQFVPTQNAVFSFLMSLFFIISLVSYGWSTFSRN